MSGKLMVLIDRLDREQVPLTNGDWARLSGALRLASAWLESESTVCEPGGIGRMQLAREAFRKAIEGSGDAQ